MGSGFKFLLGAALIGAAFIPGLGAIAGIGLKGLFLATGASLASAALFSPEGMSSQQGQVLRNSADSQNPIPVVYGRCKLGLRIVDVRCAGALNEDLYIVGALCHGSEDGVGIQAIDEVYFNDLLAFDAAGVLQDAFKDKDGNARATLTKYLGTDGQNVDTTLHAVFPTEWPTASTGRRIAYLVVKLTYDAEVWATGIPTITAIVRGNKVRDPANLAAARVYSTNPAWCAFDYMTSPRFGANVADAEMSATSFATMATYYDTVVTKDNSLLLSDKLFQCNGWLDVSQSVTDNLKTLLSSCRGIIIYEGGLYRLFTRRAVTPASFTLSEANIVGDWSFKAPGIGESPNVLRGAYIEPGLATESYPFQPETRIWPRPGATNGYLTADNSYEVTADASLPFTTDVYTAEQILLVTLKELRSGLTVNLTATEAALQLQVGDVVPVTHPTPGWTAKNFWVMGVYLIPESKLIRLALLEYDVNAYSLDPLSTVPTPPDTSLPNPFTVAAPTGLALASSDGEAIPDRDGSHRVYIRATWVAAAEAYLDFYEVEYRLSGTENWLPAPDQNRTDTEAMIGPVSEGLSYDVRVRTMNTIGRTSQWVEDAIVPRMLVLQRSGSYWIDDFTSQTPGRRWTRVGTDTGDFLDTYDPDSVVGGKVGRVTGPATFVLADAIPYDPQLLYTFRARLRQLRDPGVGAKNFSIGVFGLAEVPGQTGVFTYVNVFGEDSIDNQHWLMVNDASIDAGRAWSDYVAHFTGFAGGKVELTSSMLSQSGLGSFSAANLTDGDTIPTKVGFSTDAAGPGDYLKMDFITPKTITEVRYHMSAAGSVAQWELEYSDDNTTWVQVT